MELRGNYLIKPKSDLGFGAFGRVEKVEVYNTDGHLCGEYARKVLSVNPVLLNEYFSVDDWKRRFKREVDYQAKCNHNHIVRICIHHLNIENPWFVMELAETDLRSELKLNSLSDDEKLSALKMVYEGVGYIHDKGLLHRDLKPENILKFDGGCYKISDFGLIKSMDSKAQTEFLSGVLQDKQMGIGTPKYMSDEAKRGVYTPKSDIYALGVITSEMNLSHIDGITALIDKSAAFTPRSRYDSVFEMIDILDGIIAARRGK
ncbi:protein kinase [Pectobacterium versatile]|uniref:protein kinase domain-containing protein n=1 Tax=Pectobacterium versatile TaxID=2488639 RepID=UPI001B3A56FD|nr:protein kinase [Pectobacterium versatile]MBQ4781929.1 protein kinase [Pectobacterium versatile]MBQ4786389.1 protein kinase [Pectobacterium versatile]